MRVSVVIRAKNEAASIGRTLDLLRGQTVDAELIVVDSGSTDGTQDIAREHDARVIEIPAEDFTFGGSLNLGAGAASAPIVVALSAHAFPRDPGWLERMLEPFDDPRTACATGAENGPDGAPLAGNFVQDWAAAQRNPYWGYSNAAGAFRRDLQREYAFRADMPGTEDKEWSWHWLQEGWTCVLGPGLSVDHDHSNDPIRDTWVRATREWVGYRMYLPVEPMTLRDALREWRAASRQYRHPINILREGAAAAGQWWVRRKG